MTNRKAHVNKHSFSSIDLEVLHLFIKTLYIYISYLVVIYIVESNDYELSLEVVIEAY